MAIKDPVALLKRLASERGEAQWLEFKVNNATPEMIGETLSALANGAMLADRDRAYLVFGVEDKSRQLVGTNIKIGHLKKGAEELVQWINRLLSPRLLLDFVDFSDEEKSYSILTIELSYERPVAFSGTEFIRIGENVKKLREFPDHERALWLATSRRRFEQAAAAFNQNKEAVAEKLEIESYHKLLKLKPPGEVELYRKLVSDGILEDELDGHFTITNLGALLLARDISVFPSIKSKSVRVIKYQGTDKRSAEFEQEGRRGYALGFSPMMRYVMRHLPTEERYVDGVRTPIPLCPEIAVREVVANALIHQDFTIGGAGPVIEIYDDRIEVINQGNSLIEADRMVDERRSRNERLALALRMLGICEERGGGLDKAIIAIEEQHLPAFELNSSGTSMRVVLFGRKPFKQMSKADKIRACFYHCVIRWVNNDYMSNSSLRARFSLPDEEYQVISGIIGEALKQGRIAPADPNQGNRFARYIPYWAS